MVEVAGSVDPQHIKGPSANNSPLNSKPKGEPKGERIIPKEVVSRVLPKVSKVLHFLKIILVLGMGGMPIRGKVRGAGGKGRVGRREVAHIRCRMGPLANGHQVCNSLSQVRLPNQCGTVRIHLISHKTLDLVSVLLLALQKVLPTAVAHSRY